MYETDWSAVESSTTIARPAPIKSVSSMFGPEPPTKEDKPVGCVSIGLASIFDVDKSWIFDSGCGYDMISMAKVKFLERQYRSSQTFVSGRLP